MKFKAPEIFYKSLFNNMIDGLAYCQMLFDEKGKPIDFIYLKVNKNFEKLTGLKEVEGKKVTEVIPGIEISNPELFKIYGRVSISGVSERFETHLEPLSRWFMVSVYSLEKKYFVAIFQNVTKQKQIENKIKVAEKKFRGVFEGAGDGILAIETKSRKIIFANPTFCEMIGYSENELKKLKTEDIHPKEELLSILDKFKKATEAKHAVIIRDIPVLKNDKKIIYCDISSRIIKIGNQELALGFFRDITYHISQNNREKSK